MVAYTFTAVPYTLSHVSKLDSMFTQATKKIYRLGQGVSRAMAHDDVAQGGLGCPSLMVEYGRIQVQRLVRSLMDEASHGVITRAILQAQLVATHPASKTPPLEQLTIVCNSIRPKQLETMRQLGLELHKNCEITKGHTTPQELPVRLTTSLLGRGIADAAAKACSCLGCAQCV